MDFDLCYQDVTSDQDTEANIKVMKYLYADAANALPPNALNPKGRPIYIICFINSDNDGYMVTRKYKTSKLIYFNIHYLLFEA